MGKCLIWGAGYWGYMAYWYYKDKREIVGFIDSNPGKIGNKYIDGLDIYSPGIIEDMTDICVIIAVEKNAEIEKSCSFFGVKYSVFSPNMFKMCVPYLLDELNRKRSIDLGAFYQGLNGK